MTPYERAYLIGVRTQQLARGCKSTLHPDLVAGKSPEAVTLLELAANSIPIIVSRTLPDGTREDIPARQLRVPGDFRV